MILALCSRTFYYKYFWTFCLFLSKFTACRVVCFTELCDILSEYEMQMRHHPNIDCVSPGDSILSLIEATSSNLSRLSRV